MLFGILTILNTVSYNLESLPDDICQRIKSALDEVLPEATRAISADNVDIVFNTNVEQTIPETGVGGSTETPNLVVVSIDINHENVVKNIEKEVKGVVVHELHHAMRNRLYPWPGTLLDDIVAEGLADHFDIEVNGKREKPWTNKLSEEELSNYKKKAEAHFYEQNTEEDYCRWILGFGDESIPEWAGYALGFKIVGDYIQRTGMRPSQLVETPPVDFIK